MNVKEIKHILKDI